jgi:hypothetical protein
MISGNLISSRTIYSSKLIGGRNNIQNENVVLIPQVETFRFSEIQRIFDNNLPSVSNAKSPIELTYSVVFVSPGNYVDSAENSYFSDVIYQGGLSQTIHVQQLYTGLISFDSPCSILGTTDITSFIIAHPLYGDHPSWITLSSDSQYLHVTSPSISEITTYYLTIRSVIHGENVDKFITVELYQ